jgi:hypothetical protein
MTASFRLLTPPLEYERRLLRAFGEELGKRFNLRSSRIVKSTQDIVRVALARSNTAQSLLFGKLKSDFGLSDTEAGTAVAGIIDTVISRITVSLETNNIRSYSVVVTLLPQDVIPKIASSFLYDSEGVVIPWADWLLLQGTRVVVSDYSVEEVESEDSRSGDAIMKKGGFFRVDPEFAGTAFDNWITRVIISQAGEILQTVGKNIAS